IEKVLEQYGMRFGRVGADAGIAWVREFEKALKNVAGGAGAIASATAAAVKAGAAVPKLAAGGIVTAPTLAVIGDTGPEAVIPLRGLSTTQPGALPAALASASTSGKPSLTLNSYVYTNA